MRYECALLLLLGVTNVLAYAPARNLTICKPWACIQQQLNVSGAPSRAQLEAVLARRLPAPEWTRGARRALDACLSGGAKPRRYSATCPAQETWHCIVDQLIDNCPESKLKKEDACTPVSSILGVKYLFSQSTYLDIERNIQNDQRPAWFLRNYLSAKCCDLPALFSTSELQQCNVTDFLNVRQHQIVSRPSAIRYTTVHPTTTLQGVTLKPSTESYCALPLDNINPLECCDTSDFISNDIYGECGVEAEWDKEKRIILKELGAITTTTEAPTTVKVAEKKHYRRSDIKVLPVSVRGGVGRLFTAHGELKFPAEGDIPCPQTTCVFSKLGVVAAGVVDRVAFAALLDNVTREHAEWGAARARVVARCLRRSVAREYDAACEINALLSCAFDVLAENCPNAKKGVADPCRHSSLSQNTSVVCQVSSSKYIRSRHRYCDVPRLVPSSVLSECGVTSLSRMETAKQEPPIPKRVFKYKPSCVSMSKSTSCILSKAQLLNKYGFVDSVQLSACTERATRRTAWATRAPQVAAAMRVMPLYHDSCTSPRKLLNLLDVAVTNCPIGKRKYTSKCMHFFEYLNKCTNASASFTSKPVYPHYIPGSHAIPPPAEGWHLGVIPLSPGRAPPSFYSSAYSHRYTPSVGVVQSQYAPRHPYYIPGSHAAHGAPTPPPAAGWNLGVIPLSPGSGPPPFMYGPGYPHHYTPSLTYQPQLSARGPNDRLVPYMPYFKDGFRSASDPFALHNRIVDSQKGSHSVKATRLVLVNQTPTPIQHLQPVEAQVYA